MLSLQILLKEKSSLLPKMDKLYLSCINILDAFQKKKNMKIAYLCYLKEYDYLRNDSQTYEEFSFAKQS